MQIPIINPFAKQPPPYGHPRPEVLFDYSVIDVETTGFSPENDTMLEISALRVRNNKVESVFSSFIQNVSFIPAHIKKLTGITEEMVACAPPMEEVLKKFLDFVGEDVIIGHNVTFDLRFITAKTTECLGKPFLNNYIDTLALSRKVFREFSSHKLEDVAKALCLPAPKHRSEADCLTTKALYDCLCHTALERNVIAFYADQRFTGKPSDITPTVDVFDETHPLYGKVCVFTGVLPINRTYAMQKVANFGGINASSITRKTNILIASNAEETSKYKKAQELIALGQDIKILNAKEFLELFYL